jgi:NAD-dependent dihydropyrimidine dehydrogenase PreA subunit
MSKETTKLKRKIIVIDEAKCDGCGDCVPACHEGALQIIDGKAKLVKEIYCDALGDCLGECPTGAISFEEREAEAYDEEATKRHVAKLAKQQAKPQATAHAGGGCPGSAIRDFTSDEDTADDTNGADAPSALRQWPVQIALVPPQAPYLQGADLLIAADCVPFAHAGFHSQLLKGKRVLIGCPKLDDVEAYVEKFQQILEVAKPKSVTVAIMEVPCCGGLQQATQQAAEAAGYKGEVKTVVVGVDGELRK